MFFIDFAAPSGVLAVTVFSEIDLPAMPFASINLMAEQNTMSASIVTPDFPSKPKFILIPDQSPMHVAIVFPDAPSPPKFILIPDQSPMHMAIVFPDLPSKPK
jgi:hypothetical protein